MDQARRLLDRNYTSTLVALRNRALIGVMIYSFARIGAVVAMRGEDYYPGGQTLVAATCTRKGGERYEMPAHHKLERFIDEYIAAVGIREEGKTSLFRSAIGKTSVLTDKPTNRDGAYPMCVVARLRPGSRSRSAAWSSARPASPPISRLAVLRTPKQWPRMRAHAPPPSSTIAPATRLRSMRSKA